MIDSLGYSSEVRHNSLLVYSTENVRVIVGYLLTTSNLL